MNKTMPASGSDIVLRGLMLLALMLMLTIGGYALFFHRSSTAPSSMIPEPEHLLPMVAQSPAGFPATLSWGTVYALAQELPSQPGWRVRYQAACSLANQGGAVPWDVYREILDERRQFCNFRRKLPDGQIVVEEASARQIILGALKDLATWHEKHGQNRSMSMVETELLEVYKAVDKLAESPIAELSAQAKKTRATFPITQERK